MASTADLVLGVLADVADAPEVWTNLDMPLYDGHVLDSLRTVELIIALSEKLGVEISPAEFDREQWATPRGVIAYMENKLAR